MRLLLCIFILSIRLIESTDWKACYSTTFEKYEKDSSDVLFFPNNDAPSVIKKERLNLLDDKILMRGDQQLDYLIVSGLEVTYCQLSARDEIFKTGPVSCVKKRIEESNFLVSTIECGGRFVAYRKMDNVSPMSITKDGKFHKILQETCHLGVILREETLLTGALFAALGATVASVTISLIYIRFKLLLTRKMATKHIIQKKKSLPPPVVRKKSSTSMLTDPDLATKIKVELMVKAPKKPPTPKVTATPRILEERDEL